MNGITAYTTPFEKPGLVEVVFGNRSLIVEEDNEEFFKYFKTAKSNFFNTVKNILNTYRNDVKDLGEKDAKELKDKSLWVEINNFELRVMRMYRKVRINQRAQL